MKCPVCGGDTVVVDSRTEVDCINRRRKCLGCDYRWNTVEVDADLYEKVSVRAQEG